MTTAASTRSTLQRRGRTRGLDEQSRRLGVVYTPAVLADWLAEELLALLPSRGESSLVLDPACGEGALLKAIAQRADPGVQLFGFDIDDKAMAETRRALDPAAVIQRMDGLLGVVEDALPRSPDAVIANPPWGAELSASRLELRERFTLAVGQFDSYELFLERYLRVVREGGYLAFIVPDSIFLPEHEPARRLLVDESEILILARLGEGFFPGIFRATTVVIARAAKPAHDHQVSCFRLTPKDRKRVLSGEASLGELHSVQSHFVPQSRFASHRRTEFNIDIAVHERQVIHRFDVDVIRWDDWFEVSRGVELGKTGRVIVCTSCGTARPKPRTPAPTCSGCGVPLTTDASTSQSIVRSREHRQRDGRWVPLIVGEDVDRYRAIPSREILLDVPGIRYKNSAGFTGRRLLIRKTGVGLKGALDESGALTTQVVFLVRPTAGAPDFALEYLLGVLCSRPLFAAHLRMSGETEWRSHPYITPTKLRALPIPDPGSGYGWRWQQAKAIAKAVAARPSWTTPLDEADLRIDRLVAGLYEFSESDCNWVASVLEEAQALEPMTALRLPDHALLRPERVEA